ncbi:hypothetical protein FIBSPDRAFT_970185 [Athelia psychrophila]|uniref:Uncharacterized protein n=1 Tax=Athelia psychrophila TaxID=1759441 RepID=A0A167SVQ4_9AGAM|nr:hypothetical protein FIBSPDRAFT_970185 [Fibularhizoctonia sp. CBS 109695]
MISDHKDSFEFTTEDWLGDSIGQSSHKKSQATLNSSKVNYSYYDHTSQILMIV